MSALRSAVAFLTPLGRASLPTSRALAWFPVVGASLGCLLGLLWWAADRAWPPLVAAVIVVAADLVLTGMLHLDGLIDSADGLLPPLGAERRLEVMADPRAGAFGVGAAALLLVARVAALGSSPQSSLWRPVLLLAGLWCLARSVMALVTTLVPYARASTGGLASAFLGGDVRGVRLVGTAGIAASLALLLAWRPRAAPAVLAASLASSAAVVFVAKRRLGGFTGDVLGAAGVMAETVGLLVAVARW